MFAAPAKARSGVTPLKFEVTLQTISSGYDGKTFWVHPRPGVVPGAQPTVVLTLQKALKGTGDYFYALNEMRTSDLGRTWEGPIEHATLGRRPQHDNLILGIADFTPAWHAASGKLLGIGIETRYSAKGKLTDGPGRTAYAVYDHERREWAPWAVLELPDLPHYYYAAAGCVQRVDLTNGDVLVPIHFKPKGPFPYTTTVLVCSFDGRKLTYRNRGDDVKRPFEADRDKPASEPTKPAGAGESRQAGLFEPSLTHHHGRFFLTMRNDRAGYVATSADGLRFDTPRRWRYDDGEQLGTYNTQHHWVTHSEGLFLVYTRKGANNDHVPRHRAPLFIAQVDPEDLCLIRSTERILIPQRGASLGNFGVTAVNAQESWVTSSEWMDGRSGMEKHGSDNSVFVAKIAWSRPNKIETAVANLKASAANPRR